MDLAESYTQMRPQLLSIAYNMLGSLSEAEDVVQDVYFRIHRLAERAGDDADQPPIESPGAYLTTITTRLALDQLRSARLARRAYPGAWLPEPVLTDPGPGPGEHTELAETLSLALLTVLERLTPTERAVFLLHESFGYAYDEIARILGKSEANCRQIGARARRHLAAHRPRFDVASERHQELTDRFVAACREGQVEQLLEMLTADAVAYTDGGTRVRAALRPIYGRDKVARFLAGIARSGGDVVLRSIWVNGQPARLVLDAQGHNIIGVLTLDIVGDQVQTVRLIVNPDKLRHLPEALGQ
ncbi:MAG TPA: RNA polymerase sigma-70 factor [Jatrophihabitantaceae bacterium]|jgi:RNA polymerase sigma-70 factor (ECF subfamily)